MDFGDFERLRELSNDAAASFAARAALRVFPLLVELAESDAEGFGIVILPSFRRIAMAWVGAQWPLDSRGLLTSFDAGRDALRFGGPLGVRNEKRPDIVARAIVLAASATSAARLSADHAGNASDRSKYNVPLLARTAAEEASRALAYAAADAERDLNFGGLRRSAIEGAREMLWFDGAPREISGCWRKLKDLLLAQDNDWDVWTDWYEARLRGRPADRVLEVARVEEITEEEWEAGPAVVNARLKEIEERFKEPTDEGQVPPVDIEELPDPNPRGFAFSDDPEVPIDLQPDGVEPERPYQEELLDELRDKARRLLEACPAESNQLAALRSGADQYLEAVTPDLAALRMHLVWSRGNLLRRRLDADQRARDAIDPVSPPLDEVVAAALEDLVETHNAFIAGDAVGQDLDHASLGPRRVEATSAVDADRVLVDTIRGRREVLTARAESVLDETAAAAGDLTGDDTLHAEQALSLAEATGRNFIIAALRLVYRGAGLITGAIGAGVAGNFAFNAIGRVIAANSKVWHAAVTAHGDIHALHQLIDWIVKVFVGG